MEIYVIPTMDAPPAGEVQESANRPGATPGLLFDDLLWRDTAMQLHLSASNLSDITAFFCHAIGVCHKEYKYLGTDLQAINALLCRRLAPDRDDPLCCISHPNRSVTLANHCCITSLNLRNARSWHRLNETLSASWR